MTREEVIKALIKERKTALHENKQAFDMAIKALEQEPSEDCVSRQAVLEIVNDWWGITSTSGEPTLCDCIRDLPPVTPTTCIAKVIFSKEDMQELVDEKIKDIVAERKKGHWEQYGDSWKEKYRCSECKEEQPKMLCGEQIIGFWSDYCPNCGAEMESEE